jgi:hypothetical protein
LDELPALSGILHVVSSLLEACIIANQAQQSSRPA